jgi:uncharacterized protein YndB with AHSA1/START domain
LRASLQGEGEDIVRISLLALALCTAAPAPAEVVSAGPNAFHSRHEVELPLPPDRAWRAFGAIGAWWSKDHTYSGDAANLRLAMEPGGCFCERLPGGGGIEHLRVAYADPGSKLVLTGSLGPLLYEATSGVLDVTFKPTAAGTQVSWNYKVTGFAAGNGDKLAPLVDRVLGEQLAGLRRSVR